jgi:hypothetical protein
MLSRHHLPAPAVKRLLSVTVGAAFFSACILLDGTGWLSALSETERESDQESEQTDADSG